MIVVIDTTETFDDLRMKGPNFQLLGKYLIDTNSRLLVPEVVFEETVKHFRGKLRKSIQALKDNARDFAKLTNGSLSLEAVDKVDEQSVVETFRQQFLSELRAMRGCIIGYESISVKELVHRSLHCRLPFSSDGKKGFRDALLWETFLREVIAKYGSSTEIAFITNNTKDFCVNGRMAEELELECQAVCNSTTSVRMFANLGQFVDVEVKPHLKKLDGIREQLAEGKFGSFDAYDFFKKSADEIKELVCQHIRQCDFSRITRDTGAFFYRPELLSMDQMCGSADPVDVWSVDDSFIAVGIDFTVNGEVKCVWGHGFSVPRYEEFYEDFSDDDFVGDVELKLVMTVILQRSSGEVQDFQLDELEVKLGWKWPYRDDD